MMRKKWVEKRYKKCRDRIYTLVGKLLVENPGLLTEIIDRFEKDYAQTLNALLGLGSHEEGSEV